MTLKIKWSGLILTSAAFIYFARAMNTGPDNWHVIDNANLIFHEAGHTLFMWAPYWLEIAGGSLFQVLLPLGLSAYSFWKRQPLAGAVMLMWAGQSCANVSVYMADALKQQLPLIADGAIHDWNHLFASYGLLRHTALLAGSVKILGWLSLLIGFGLGCWVSLIFGKTNENPEAPNTPS